MKKIYKNNGVIFFLSVLFVLVVCITGHSSADTLTKEDFLNLTDKIDSATATAMAENLTDADWFEGDSELLLDAFHATLEARKRFAWGNTIPQEIYLQYVVPLRMDGEPLQNFRRKFLEEIGPRLKTIDSLAHAALEVNIYLAERVRFKSTDRRDQGPLTTLSTGRGRCEEKTILAVDVLRSVGIPARAVMIPYFSASDNNHVWVEVYTEDGWKYMEPANLSSRLNKAWFDRKVPRAGIILTLSRRFNESDANAIKMGTGYALNLTSNYMNPAKLTVEMPENWGEKDRLWLALFNFGTIRPIAELVPKEGVAILEIGNGDFVLMGLHDGKLFFQTFTSQLGRETKVKLGVSKTVPQDFTLTYPWPPANELDEIGEPDLISNHRIELAKAIRREHDQKRKWASEWLDRFVSEGGSYSKKLYKTLKRSLGNEATVLNAVLDVEPEQRENAIYIASHLPDKFLWDVKPEVLTRWLKRKAGQYAQNKEFKPYVLNPQIGYEYSGTGLPNEYKTSPLNFISLDELRKDVERYAPLVDTRLSGKPLPPVTLDNMLADGISVNAKNAALWWTDRLRRSGVPARRKPYSSWLEFFYEGNWLPMFPDQPGKLGDRNTIPEVKAHYESPAIVQLSWKEVASAPKWKSEFLFLSIKKNGFPDYRKDIPRNIKYGKNNTVLLLDPGKYLFTAGRRNGRGDVAVQIHIVNLDPHEHLMMKIDLMPPPEPPARNSDLQLKDLEWQPKTAAGQHLLIILGDNEPSIRIRELVKGLKVDGVSVDFITDMNLLSASDREKLGLKGRDEAGTPYVYYFDEEGAIQFSQSGYDLNLLNRLQKKVK